MRVLILGVSGMLGHTLMQELPKWDGLDVVGAARQPDRVPKLPGHASGPKLFELGDATDPNQLIALMNTVRPDLVVNCVGVIKQHSGIANPIRTIEVNSVLPHRLDDLTAASGARVIQISTDCVFAGTRGHYAESDPPDAMDLYGRSKLLGELSTSNSITLRTSMIGHEIGTAVSLIDWFLAQTKVNGFLHAIYSGLTTVELCRVIAQYVIPNDRLTGLFHVAAEPISKYALLELVSKQYNWRGNLVPESAFHCDRSLNGDRFRQATGYIAPPWASMVRVLHESYLAKPGPNPFEVR